MITEPASRLSRLLALSGTATYTESVRLQQGISASELAKCKERLTNSVSATVTKVKQVTRFEYHLESHVSLLKDMSILAMVTVWIEVPFDDEL